MLSSWSHTPTLLQYFSYSWKEDICDLNLKPFEKESERKPRLEIRSITVGTHLWRPYRMVHGPSKANQFESTWSHWILEAKQGWSLLLSGWEKWLTVLYVCMRAWLENEKAINLKDISHVRSAHVCNSSPDNHKFYDTQIQVNQMICLFLNVLINSSISH